MMLGYISKSKNFYKLFPTATKVLEELISNTATTIRKEVAKGKIK